MSAKPQISAAVRWWVTAASLVALFLGALDALIMSAAMPTIIADLGGLDLYSWVYSTYFLSRAVSLPIFGKLADLYKTKTLFIVSIAIFILASLIAGAAPTISVLILARVLQGIGAGGNFALVYIVLSDIAAPGKRGKLLSVASTIWGLASVLGPTLGGVIVTYFSWRWIFYINIPVGLFSIALLAVYLVEVRSKKDRVDLDIAGVLTLSIAILGFLSLIMFGGQQIPWRSVETLLLVVITLAAAAGFYWAEQRAKDPILSLAFFKIKPFSVGNGSVFLCSFSIFALFAYAPLYVQGALGKTPLEVGWAMLALSLGWSVGAFFIGQLAHRIGNRAAAVWGAVFLSSGCGFTLLFSTATTMATCLWVFALVGLGMGFVSLSTLLVVQTALDASDLGVATSTHQFARTMGGAVGVGVAGGFLGRRISASLDALTASGQLDQLAPEILTQVKDSTERLFQPEFQNLLAPEVLALLQQAVGVSVASVYWVASFAALGCLILSGFLPSAKRQ